MPAVPSILSHPSWWLPGAIRLRVRPSTLLLLVAGLAGTFGLAFWGIFLWADYRREVRAAEAYSDATIDALGEHVRRVVATSDLMLNQLLGMLAANGLEAYQTDEAAWQQLRNLALLPQHAAVLTVFDASGRPLLTSRGFGAGTPALDARTYPFFQTHRQGNTSGLLIGPTLIHPVDRFPYLIFSRALYDEDELFEGVVMAAIRADQFLQFAQKVVYGPRSTVSVVRDDGLILIRQPLTPEVIQVSLSNYELFTQYLQHAPRGRYDAISPVDSEPRLITYQRLEDQPLVLIVGLSWYEVLRDWWRRAYQTSALMLLGLLAIGGLALYGSRHAAREEEVQRELAASREHEHLLMAELNHRSRNLLALVQSLVRQSARSAEDKVALEEGLLGRIQSLAKSHELLSAEKWQAVDLRTLVERELRPYDEAGRIRIEGGPVRIPARIAPTLGMAMHELATNCAKHGALSGPGGRLDVRWRLEGADGSRLHLSWHEAGGPRVTPPNRRGFGMDLLEHSLVHGLEGSLDLDFRPEGLRAEITARLDEGA